MKRVMTVTGPIDPGVLGVTLMHEHLFADFRRNFVEPDEASIANYRYKPVDIEMIPLLRQRPFSVSLDNAILGDETLMQAEALNHKAAGGHAIVDVTPIGVGRDPLALQRLSRTTGIWVVMGGGLYIENMHPGWSRDASVEDLSQLFIREATVGVDDTGVRTGIIGEIGTSGIAKGAVAQDGPMTAAEEKVLVAAAHASNETGLAITIHLDPRVEGAFRTFEVLSREGVPPDRIVMGHLDLREDKAYHRAVADLGVYLEFDCFGRESYTHEWGNLAFGHDTRRVESISELVAAGFDNRVVLAHDIALKMDLRKFGGIGFGHVLSATVPMLRRAGVSERSIMRMLIDNPRDILTVDLADDLLEAITCDIRQQPSPPFGPRAA